VHDQGVEKGEKKGRKEERAKAEVEKAELLQQSELEKAELKKAEKLNTAKRLLGMGFSIADVAKGADLDHSIVLKLA